MRTPRLSRSFLSSLVVFTALLHLLYVATGFGLSFMGVVKVERRGSESGWGSSAWKRAGGALLPSSMSQIHVLLTATPTYLSSLLCLLNSTLSSSSPTSYPLLQFHLVSSSKAEVDELLDMVETVLGLEVRDRVKGYSLEELHEEGRLGEVKVWAGYRSSTLSQPIVFARYLVPKILPTEVERVIYLDQDVLVKGDLRELWETDLEGWAIGAARLCRPTALWRKQFVMDKQPLVDGQYDHDTCTLNNGVLLYNLTAWREAEPSYTDALFNWTRLNSLDKLYSLGSQPPFNLVFYRKYKVLDDRWNLMDVAGLLENSDHHTGYPATRSREEVEAASILHWNGEMKPWLCDGEGDYSELWTKFLPAFREYIPDSARGSTIAMCSKMVITDLPQPPSVEQFTVVIVSFARIDTVVKIAKHLQRSTYVKEIIVAWNNLATPCPTEINALPWVRCIPQEANLVHNRFLVWPYITTEAVLHYDDDLIAPLEDLEAAFQLWRRHRDQIVGFEPRYVLCDEDEENDLKQGMKQGFRVANLPELSEVGPAPTMVPTTCHYRFKLKFGYFDLTIGKLFMVSRSYMEAYFLQSQLVELSTHAPCEDLAMGWLVSYLSLPPNSQPRAPLLFKSNLTETHSKLYDGLSQGIVSSVWRHERGECVNELLKIYNGRRPGAQNSFYERDDVRQRIYRLPVESYLKDGWCSDTKGGRACRQP